MFGSREVTDFDGHVLSEKELARKYGVVGTPTIQFLPERAEAIESKRGRAIEIARMPGYFKPEHFIAMFEYVAERGYEREPFARYSRRATASQRARSGRSAASLRRVFVKLVKTTRIGRSGAIGVGWSC